MKIPKIIHQTWKTEQVPNTMKNYAKSWKEKNPNFTYMFWTDYTIRDLIKKHYPWFLKYFDSYPHQIMRVDAFRLFVLDHYGGFYADLDLECYKPIEPLLEESTMLLFLEWPGSISNAIMASIPGHPFIKHCFKELVHKHVYKGPNTAAWEATGPKFITNALKKYKLQGFHDYKLYPSYFFFPIPWHKPRGDQSGQGQRYPRSFGAHHWQGTWWQEQPITNNTPIFCITLFSLSILLVILIGVYLKI